MCGLDADWEGGRPVVPKVPESLKGLYTQGCPAMYTKGGSSAVPDGTRVLGRSEPENTRVPGYSASRYHRVPGGIRIFGDSMP